MPIFSRQSLSLPVDLSPRSPARTILALAVMATLAGSLETALRGSGSGWNSWLFLERHLSHRAAHRTELALVLAALASAAAGLFLQRHRWGSLLMLPAFAFLLAEACLVARMGGSGFAEWAPFAHSLRYGTPLALALLALRVPAGDAGAALLLRLALAAVFFAHGGEALLHNPRFIDLILGSGENLLGWRIEESQAETALTCIAWLDFAVAALVLVRPAPAVLWWMAFWGLLTALSRMTSFGWDAHREVLLRASHFLVPFVLVWFRIRKQGPEKKPVE